jgi:sugar lactone lactonase YvrE
VHRGTRRRHRGGDRPFGLSLSPDGGRLYVSHLRASRLTILDLEQGRIDRTVSLAAAGAATEVVAIARLDDDLWLAMRPPQP